MSHPTEQLAAYVDGTLPPGERAGVDTHLTTCARCRSEVAAAGAGREALRSMTTPVTPDDLGGPALAEMGRTHAGPPGWVRFTPWLAAAAVVALLALALPRIGSSSDDTSGAAVEADTQMPVTPKDLRLEIIAQDFDPASLEAAALEFVGTARADDGEAGGTSPGEANVPSPTGDPVRAAGEARSNAALHCLRTAVPDLPGTPVRLVKASFRGTPAYLAFVLEGPGAGQPADTVSIWAVSVKDCSVLSLASAAL